MNLLLLEVLDNLIFVSGESQGDLHYYNMAGVILNYIADNIENEVISQLIRPLSLLCCKIKLSYIGYQIEQIHARAEMVRRDLHKLG